MTETRHDAELFQLHDRVSGIIAAARLENRDITPAELAECRSAGARMEALRDQIEATETADQLAQRVGIIDGALHTRSSGRRFTPRLLVSETHLRSHLDAIRSGGVFGAVEDEDAELQTRARLTAGADMGSAGAWASGGFNPPRNLVLWAGIAVSPLLGKTAQLPSFTAPTGATGADEGSDHPEYDSVAPVSLAAARYGRWSDASSIVAELDDLRGLNQMHSWGIARDLDAVAVTALETAAGVPAGAGTDLDGAVREALLVVSAATYSDESALVLVGTPADLALLTGAVPTSGDDVGTYATRFHGARLYASLEASAGQVTAFAPSGFRVFQSQLRSATTIDPASGATKFGQWLHSTPVAQQLAGSAAAVATDGS